jgi:hypothetical protein
MSWELLWRTFGWFTLVWFVSAGLFVIVMQFLLPLAWKEIRANPPSGPEWAHMLWYRRERVYGALMSLALALGTLAAALFLLGWL